MTYIKAMGSRAGVVSASFVLDSGEITMAEFNWGDNAEAVFKKCLEVTPGPFRKRTERDITAELVKQFGEGGAVDEAGVMAAIKATTPRAYLGMGLKKLAPMLNDPGLAEIG
jgi:hypothetical protein